MYAFGGLISALIGLILLIYPYAALGRIWLYSKQQVELLQEIRDESRKASS